MSRGRYPPASDEAHVVPTAATPNASASHKAGDLVRPATHDPSPEPTAMPAMNAASVGEKAYVVGPTSSDRTRVQTISRTSAANPETPRATEGSQSGSFITCAGAPRPLRPAWLPRTAWAAACWAEDSDLSGATRAIPSAP